MIKTNFNFFLNNKAFKELIIYASVWGQFYVNKSGSGQAAMPNIQLNLDQK